MATLNMTLVDEALKLYYLKGLRYQLNEESSDFLREIERDSESVEGGQIVMALRYGRQGGVGNRADDADLPTPNPRKTKQAKWDTKNVFARILISDKVIKAARGNAGAFAPMLETELEDAEKDAKEMLAREVFGDGTGVLATVTAVSGNVLTVGTDNIHLFAVGMWLDSYTSTGTLHKAQMEVLVVDDEDGTITVDAAGTTAAGDYLYVNGNKDQELTGLKGVADNTVLYGIDRTTNTWLKLSKINVNGEISEVIIQKAIHEARRKAGAKIDFLLCSFGVSRAYQNLLVATRQIVNTTELKGGAKTLAFDAAGKVIPLVADNYCGKGQLWALSREDWKMYELDDWDWLDRHGAILRPVSGKAVYEAVLAKYCDLGCSRPRGQVLLNNITEH